MSFRGHIFRAVRACLVCGIGLYGGFFAMPSSAADVGLVGIFPGKALLTMMQTWHSESELDTAIITLIKSECD